MINSSYLIHHLTGLCVYIYCESIGLVKSRDSVLRILSPFSADAAGQLDVLGHNGNTLGVDGTQVGILEQTNEVCL